MGDMKNSVYHDSKDLEGIYFLKIVYDLFPGGTYKLSDFYKKIEENEDSILKQRSDAFSDAERIGHVELLDYIYGENRKCCQSGLISRTGEASEARSTVTRTREEVERALSDPWRSLETDVDCFSRGDGISPTDIAYYRDFITQAKEYHGREEKSMSDFFKIPVSEYNGRPQTGVVTALYRKGFLELRGRMRPNYSNIPAFVPLKIRLKKDLFKPDVSDKIKNSGYRSESWDGRLPDSYRDIETLEKMFKAQPFSNYDFSAGGFFRMGYLEKTTSYLSSRVKNDKGSDMVYRLKDDFAKALFGQAQLARD